MYYKNWAKLFSSNWAGESCIYRENYESWNEIKFMFYVNPDVMYIVIRSFASGFYAVKKILLDWVCPVLHAFTLHFICSYALSPMHLFILLVRSFICSFARSLFVQSSVCFLFVYSLVCFLFTRSLFLFFFTHSFPLSFSYPFVPFLFHSLCFSHPFAVSVLHSLVRFLLHSLVTWLFCSNFFSQYFTVSLILFFFFLVTHGSFPFLLVCWHAFSFATPSLFGFLSPSPLPYPLPLKFFLFFCPSVPSSLPICYFFVLNSQRNVSHFNPSKGCFIEKIFYKTVYSSYVVHGTAFRVFFISSLL